MPRMTRIIVLSLSLTVALTGVRHTAAAAAEAAGQEDLDRATEAKLTVGKLADLAVLSDNYLTVSESDIRGLSSVLTLLGGEIVYSDPAVGLD